MANGKTGEFWVIAVLPDYEMRGIGSKLLLLAEDWLRSIGWEEIWLWTAFDTNLKAYSFYRNRGWTDSEILRNQRLVSASAGLLHKIRVTLDEAVHFPIIGQQI
jgi:GNAT superfamily N-acetyltransferase